MKILHKTMNKTIHIGKDLFLHTIMDNNNKFPNRYLLLQYNLHQKEAITSNKTLIFRHFKMKTILKN